MEISKNSKIILLKGITSRYKSLKRDPPKVVALSTWLWYLAHHERIQGILVQHERFPVSVLRLLTMWSPVKLSTFGNDHLDTFTVEVGPDDGLHGRFNRVEHLRVWPDEDE